MKRKQKKNNRPTNDIELVKNLRKHDDNQDDDDDDLL